MNKKFPELCCDDICTGCMACLNACSINAISLVTNNEGFYRPQIDRDNCIQCGRCEKACPIIHKPKSNEVSKMKVYAAWNNNDRIRRQSSSGGAFSALAETIIEAGGLVIGAMYESPSVVKHTVVDNKEDLAKLRLSKYVQSNIGGVYKTIKSYLKEGRKVLFVGTPCQVAGLKSFLMKDYENLWLCDFICHGVPSTLMLSKYFDWLSPQIGTIKHINFRDKRKGWYDSLRVVKLDKDKEKILKGNKDAFWVGYNNNNNNLQHSCYQCRFLGVNRISDITIADFWGIGKSIPFEHKNEIEKGISCLLVNNDKATRLVDCAKDKMVIHERTLDEVLQGNKTLIRSCVKPYSRKCIYNDLQSMTYEDFRVKYLIPNNKTKLVKMIREYLPYSIVSFIRMRNQK